MLAVWGPATAAAFARYDGEPDGEILAAAQARDRAVMADPVARARQELDFWTGRLEAELREVETIDDYRRSGDEFQAPLAADVRDRFRRALHLAETGTPIPGPYLARRCADCLDMAGHAAAGIRRTSGALLDPGRLPRRSSAFSRAWRPDDPSAGQCDERQPLAGISDLAEHEVALQQSPPFPLPALWRPRDWRMRALAR